MKQSYSRESSSFSVHSGTVGMCKQNALTKLVKLATLSEIRLCLNTNLRYFYSYCLSEGRERCAQGFGGGNLRERDRWGDQDVDERIILRWILKWEGVVGTGWGWLRIGTGGGRL